MNLSMRMTLSATALMALAAAAGCGRSVCAADSMAYGNPESRNGAGSPTSSSGSTGTNPTPADAARAVEEADIIQVDGGRLYAMSRVSGLSVVDVSSNTQLALLGKHAVAGVPFEMYRRGDVVFAMSNNAIDKSGSELSTPPVDQNGTAPALANGMPAPSTLPYSAQISAIDVRDPKAISKIASFQIPGEIADSRAVGDVLYIVSYENGACFKCGSTKRTVITSFDVRNPAKIAQVDQVSFTSDMPGYPAWKRSVTATENRLYVAGPDFTFDPAGGSNQSVIDVLDVSDPSGKIGVGAKVYIKGQILSRWQMDEHAGVLRVISQRDIAITRNGSGEPFVDTFKIDSSKVLTPLGATTLKLPIQEALKAVRFDGTRAYAITFRNTDPLFTLDLSNPAAPLQKGELEIPGFVHHIEPRGDRLVALGVDQGATTGTLNVSLFDVSDMTKPAMLSRVSFGQYNGLQDLTEDQNRIHKAFRVFDDHNLIVIPHTSHYERNYGVTTCSPNQGGIQLVDIANDQLTLRAKLDIPGIPRRALVQNGRLLAVSETNIRSFSLIARDRTTPEADLPIAAACTLPQGYGGYGGSDYYNGRGYGYGYGGGGCD